MRIRGLLAGGAGLAMLTGALLIGAAPASQGATPIANEGIECEPGNGTYSMTATTGHISTPDGNSLFSWGYGTGTRAFQLPGPVLCVNAGDHVTITLNNALTEDTSLVFPGQTGVKADGVPSAPQADSNGRVTSLAPVAAAKGGSVTYDFVAGKPGTYLYESGTDTTKQIEMGLYGAIIVRPAGHPTQAYDDPRTAFEPGREFLHILAQVDPDAHLAVEQGKVFDWSTYVPKYYLLNGRSAPDTLSPNDASWLPTQPYGAMVHVRPQGAGGDSLPALVRYLNVTGTDVPFHPHSNSEKVIANDAQPLLVPGQGDHTYPKFVIDIGANRTVDATFTWTDVEHYDPTTNPVPVTIPAFQDVLIAGTWWSMSPYLGVKGNLPSGIADFNQCGEYYQVAHNHALNASTNWGVPMGGQLTFIRIDPPNGCPAA